MLQCLTRPATGGGWISGPQIGYGIQGQYFNNPSLSGSPVFTRWDNRISFLWPDGNAHPAGTPDPAYAGVGPTYWSAKWVGTLVPAFSEPYTIIVESAASSVELWITPSGQAQGSSVIVVRTPHEQTVNTAPVALTAGQQYTVELHLTQGDAALQQIRLQWLSPSTPLEDIEPITQVGLNVDGGDAVFANLVNGGTRNYWWPSTSHDTTVPTGCNGWPKADAQIMLAEGDITVRSGGSYLLQFKGKATVSCWPQNVNWIAGGANLQSSTLQSGQGYDPVRNVTTATMVVPPGSDAYIYLTFKDTSRDGTQALGTGITDLYVMQPSTLGGATPVPVQTLLTPAAQQMFSQYTVLRMTGPTGSGANPGTLVSTWPERTLPGYVFWTGNTYGGGADVTAGIQSVSAPTGVPYEILIALANQTGKDLYLNVPILASPTHVANLAKLCAYGSDGVNPYTGPQAKPTWAPLNPNLKLYIEVSNETWNSGYVHAETRCNGWANQISQRALYDYLTNNRNDPLYPGGGCNAYDDGRILCSYYGLTPANSTTFLATYNERPSPSSDGGSPQYFSNSGGNINGYWAGQGWIGLRLVQIATAFKKAFGETNLNAVDASSRIRPLFEWQYGGMWAGALDFIDTVYAGSHPVNYYLYGGGGAWYADSVVGGFTDVTFQDGYFASGLAQWTSIGTTGLAANGSDLGTPDAPPLFAPIAVSNGAIESDSTVTITTTVPHNLVAGQTVNVQGVASGDYNAWGVTIASVPSPNTLTYTTTKTGLAPSGCGKVSGPNGLKQVAYLAPGASISQDVTFSGGYADITFYLAQSVPPVYLRGLTITLTPSDSGPTINGGQPIPSAECDDGAPCFSGGQGQFTWQRSIAFDTGNESYRYTVTFSNTLSSGNLFLSGLAIQTVNGLFAEQSLNPVSVTATIQSDIALTLRYGLHHVGYEGGFDFAQNAGLGADGYQAMGWRGWSSSTPNVGARANLDARTIPLAVRTLQEYFAAGGILPVEASATSNLNSWAIAAPTYHNVDTPKFEAVKSIESAQQPSTYGTPPDQQVGLDTWLTSPSDNQPRITRVFNVPAGLYTLNLIFGTHWGPPVRTEPVHVLLDGTLVMVLHVQTGPGGTFDIPIGKLAAGQHAVTLVSAFPATDNPGESGLLVQSMTLATTSA
jgi:hypothetical protein